MALSPAAYALGAGGGAVPRTSDCSGCASPSPAWSPVASDADPSWCPDGPGDLGAQVCPGQRDGAPGEPMFQASARTREVSAPRLPGVGVPALCSREWPPHTCEGGGCAHPTRPVC